MTQVPRNLAGIVPAKRSLGKLGAGRSGGRIIVILRHYGPQTAFIDKVDAERSGEDKTENAGPLMPPVRSYLSRKTRIRYPPEPTAKQTIPRVSWRHHTPHGLSGFGLVRT
jgi:hypothetical protein